MKKFPSFTEWLKATESSASGRSKVQMALGLGPDMAAASLNSRATISPGLLDLVDGKDSHYDKKSGDKLDREFGDKPDVDADEYTKAPKKHGKHKSGEKKK